MHNRKVQWDFNDRSIEKIIYKKKRAELHTKSKEVSQQQQKAGRQSKLQWQILRLQNTILISLLL